MAFQALLPTPPSSGTPSSSDSDGPTPWRATPPHLRPPRDAPRNPRPSNPPEAPLASSRTTPQNTDYYAHRSSQLSRRLHSHQNSQFASRRPQAPKNPNELRVRVSNIPTSWTTWELYTAFERFGTISRVDMFESQMLNRSANVCFQPAPADVSWVGWPVVGLGANGAARRLETQENSFLPRLVQSTLDRKRYYPEKIKLAVLGVDFGIMETPSRMQLLQSSSADATSISELIFDLSDKAIYITFAIRQAHLVGTVHDQLVERQFKARVNLVQLHAIDMVSLSDGTPCLVFSLDSPPQVERRTSNIKKTHQKGATLWDHRTAWFRQTDIDSDPLGRKMPLQLRNDVCIIDIGRWLTYRVRLHHAALCCPEFQDLVQALEDHNIRARFDKDIEFDTRFFNEGYSLWQGMDVIAERKTADTTSSSDLYQMTDDSVHLPFALRYQLEVCLSLGVLSEVNIKRAFVERLATMDVERAIKILEKAADSKQRYFEPDQIFRLQNQVSVAQKRRPGYCTRIPSAVVTPSTIYYATPVLATSNRVIRQFHQYEDRFLRVKFTDERHRGKIMSSDDHRMNEVFSRVSRALSQGITIGDRHYDFLAFGSSQFREHGAYFFCPTPGCSASDIRAWMGDFTNIKGVAKYCARLGQCFSTTRAIPHGVNLERIPDVEKNGFCFTDGVGKLSPFLARMIAHHFHLVNSSENDCPSTFQFRLAGCKGVLAVDPALKGTMMQIRPSQEKFPAKYQGLEICRIAQFQAANLNTQLILVLSTLGVPDKIFVRKMRSMCVDLSLAMTDVRKACELLQKNIDFNQMTIALASMIYDGFMEAQDPFVITCLRLWRSWNLKYLKEKARIFVEGGAFLMGATDETQTLRGHFDAQNARSGGSKEEQLPEIFVQIPDPDYKGKFKVITGICALGRNPSLHPGDIRVVRAVNVPSLHHHRNTVILPQTGDRDLANMCSGGDLDGDDYIIIWDKDLLPPEWNHAPTDYKGPDPIQGTDAVSVKDISNFFVKHIKHDNLSRIAVAHRYWADSPFTEDGVKSPQCLELAELHSKAVDFAKTGVPAEMPAHLRVKMWPHWSEPVNKAQRKIYTSKKVLGQLYDEVRREPFEGAWNLPFDDRILEKHEPSEETLHAASAVKALYDEAMHRIMAQHGIKTEFEVASTFVLEHHQGTGDYKFAETIGEVVHMLREEFLDLCYVKAGTTSKERDWTKMKPFIIAMYAVTANEVAAALAETKETTLRGGKEVPFRTMDFDSMPFISFPWLFARELGQIATDGKSGNHLQLKKPASMKNPVQESLDLLGDDFVLPELPEVTFQGEQLHEGDVFGLFESDRVDFVATVPQPSELSTPDIDVNEPASVDVIQSSARLTPLTEMVAKYQAAGLPTDISFGHAGSHQASSNHVKPSIPMPQAANVENGNAGNVDCNARAGADQ